MPDWAIVLVGIIGGLLVLMMLRLPIAFCFLVVTMIVVYIYWGGMLGLKQMILDIFQSLTTYSLVPLSLFILMGDVMFFSGIAPNMIDALDKWLGKIPGRLSLLAVGAGTLFATLTGASMASVAMLGSTLVPEMQKRGYSNEMSLGPILGSGGLAVMIPPSGLAVLLCTLGSISIGRTLIAIILPGILMAVLFAAYIIMRCIFQPTLAPAYDVPSVSIREKLISTAKYILPLAFVIFMVIGVMFLGIATPSEAAATGALSCFILAAAYRRLNWKMLKQSVTATLRITVMIFMIVSAAKVFSELLAFSGATQGLIKYTMSLSLTPIFIMIAIQIVLIILGCIMDPGSIMMITVPLFMPISNALGFNPIWFAAVYMVNIEMAAITPPFGISLFTMKGVVPSATMNDIIKAATPFIIIDIIAMALVMIFPSIALWLPTLLR